MSTSLFDAKKYAWNVAHSRVKKAERPVTLADHEAAEREARELFNERLEGRNRNYEALPEIVEFEAEFLEGDDAAEIAAGRLVPCIDGEATDFADWGRDIAAEAEGWQKIATDFLMFKAKEIAATKKAA
ncbi:MAG TPA: hypothetical protein VN742_09605 [Candidatus Binataceae bacterium]|nr:hypothetical protein [Candidatus Binataceae bacterium]